MKVVQTAIFSKAVKKLHANQKKDLDAAVKTIMANPSLGEAKVGDLLGMSVYKFRMVGQVTLLAYSYKKAIVTLEILSFGSHENFYRDLKN